MHKRVMDRQYGLGALLRRFGHPQRRWLAGGLAATVAIVACRLAIPWPLRAALEATFPGLARAPERGGPWSFGIGSLCLFYVALALATGLGEMAQRTAMARFSGGTIAGLRARALAARRAVLRRGGSLRGDFVARLYGETARFRLELLRVLQHVPRDGLLFLAIAALFIFFMSPRLGAYFVAGGVLACAIGLLAARPAARVEQRRRETEARVTASLQNGLERGAVLPLPVAVTAAPAPRAGIRLWNLTSLAVHVVLGGTVALAVWSGVRDVQAGRLAAGTLFVFVAYALIVHRRLARLGRDLARIGRLRAWAARFSPLLRDADPAQVGHPLLRHALRLAHAQPALARGRRKVLPVDLTITAGSHVAVVGGVGAGKSTLLRCLAGAEPLAAGSLVWDGQPLFPGALDGQAPVGHCPWAPVFPPTPVWGILGLRAPEALSDSQRDLLDAIGAWKIVRRLPRSLRQRVASATLSSQEARLLAVAGILLGDAPVWLLDGPVDGLGAHKSAARLEAIVRAAKGRTLVVALARLVSPEHFDRVIALDDGAVSFDGSPAGWLRFRYPVPQEEAASCRV